MGEARNVADTLEDVEWLVETGVGATEAAERLGFASANSLSMWLRGQDRMDLWTPLRDPKGAAPQAKKGLVAVEQTVDTIAHLIEQGRKSSKARIRNKAERIDALVNELREAVHMDEESERIKEKARQDVAKLERQLAEAKARLRGEVAVQDGPTAAEVRAWAAENGIACPERGRIPADVREAFDAAQADAA